MAFVRLLADRAPGLPKTLREHDADYVLWDGILGDCDCLGDGPTDYLPKHRRNGVNVQGSSPIPKADFQAQPAT
ncbi:hypothetical protein HW445_15725 [Streptomyces sp. UH6]|nr:hypothetical protein [Streptomyces sp. UH6]